MASSNVLQLQQPLTSGGIRSVNFFNGRLLAAGDLTREQTARRSSDWRLGLALGDGVAFGLDASLDPTLSAPSAPVLRIASGLAINRAGQAIQLTADAWVALTRQFNATAASCVFTNCLPLTGGTYVAGAGVYILTIAPAETSEGRAQTNGLDPGNVACNTDATVEAVQFRLLAVNPALYAGLDPGAANFRNTLAYRCYGDRIQPGWLASLIDPAPVNPSLVDAMRQVSLTDYDVPLALLFLTGAADIQFIDQWAARRPLVRPDDEGPYASLASDLRPAVGRAMFLQFQSHIDTLATPGGDLGSVTALGNFRYLPPAGVIPVLEGTDTTDAMATRFFKGMTYRGPAFVNAARVEPLLRSSWCYPPIDTAGGEMVWLYRVRENRLAIDNPAGGTVPRSYVVFANGHLPYQADAEFDLAYWNYSNYVIAR